MLLYDISVSINPDNYSIEAEAAVTFPADWERPKFCLHKDLILDAIEGQAAGYRICEAEIPYSPEARGIDLELPLGDHERTVIFRYHGKLGITSSWEVNRISPAWTELGLYTPWYPLSVPMQNAVFFVKLNLPPGYSLLNCGNVAQREGVWLVEQTFPSLDCTIIIAPDFQVREAEKNSAKVRAFYTEADSEPAASAFSRIGAEVLERFNGKFGVADLSPIDIVIAPREKGGGYARRGFIVFTADLSLDDQVRLYRYIAHEFAHLWWYRANTSTWEDWLNESLAEYSALLALRELLGLETYNELLKVRREKSQNLPPIRGISRDAQEAQAVLYLKGCVFLAELEAELGEEKFLTFLQELIRRELADTEGFLEILAGMGGKSIAVDFARKLTI